METPDKKRITFQLKKSSEEGGFGFTDEEISWLGTDRTNSCKRLTIFPVGSVSHLYVILSFNPNLTDF